MQRDRVERREAGGGSDSSGGSSPKPGTLEKSPPCIPTLQLSLEKAPTLQLSLEEAPSLQLTFEEEFKISELMVRKDFLMDGVVEAMVEKIPHFKDTFVHYAEGLPRDFVDSSSGNGFSLGLNSRGLNDLVEEHCRPDGRIRACLEMFDEYKHVDDNVKLEIFTFSMQVVGLCTRWVNIHAFQKIKKTIIQSLIYWFIAPFDSKILRFLQPSSDHFFAGPS